MEQSKVRKFVQLSAQERALIEVQLDQGCKLRAIARSLQRAPSTISRELARNRAAEPQLYGAAQQVKLAAAASSAAAAPAHSQAHKPARLQRRYCCLRANARASQLRAKPRQAKRMAPGGALFNAVVEHLRQGLSPAQVSYTLERMTHMRISHESIYQALYVMPRGQLRSEVLALLPWGRKGRMSRGAGTDRRRGLIAGMTSIEERPIEVEERLVPGHWEGDLIKGAGNRSQIGTLVERSTLFTLLVRVPRATAAQTADAFAGVLNRVDAQKRLSLTYDQGKEMAHHEHLSRQTGMPVYFAHPHSPWERGINENTNGVLRRTFAKGTDLSQYTQEQLDAVAMKLNAKPRKSLGWKCPAELFLPEGAFDFKAYWSSVIQYPTVAIAG